MHMNRATRKTNLHEQVGSLGSKPFNKSLVRIVLRFNALFYHLKLSLATTSVQK